MAQQIDQQRCTRCGVCMDVCPNEGIEEVDGDYIILAALCTECYGYGSTPQCVDVCPADAIVDDNDHPGDDKLNALRAAFLHPERIPRD